MRSEKCTYNFTKRVSGGWQKTKKLNGCAEISISFTLHQEMPFKNASSWTVSLFLLHYMTFTAAASSQQLLCPIVPNVWVNFNMSRRWTMSMSTTVLQQHLFFGVCAHGHLIKIIFKYFAWHSESCYTGEVDKATALSRSRRTRRSCSSSWVAVCSRSSFYVITKILSNLTAVQGALPRI